MALTKVISKYGKSFGVYDCYQKSLVTGFSATPKYVKFCSVMADRIISKSDRKISQVNLKTIEKKVLEEETGFSL